MHCKSRIDLPDVTRPIGLLLPWKINGMSTADERAINKPMVTLLIITTLNSNFDSVNWWLKWNRFSHLLLLFINIKVFFLMIFISFHLVLLNLKTIESNLCVKVSLFSAPFSLYIFFTLFLVCDVALNSLCHLRNYE